MFRFHLGRIPVEIKGSHLLYAALLGFMQIQGQVWNADAPWPYHLMQDPKAPQYLQGAVAFIGCFMAIVFLSVLIHELGHAVFFLVFGYQPTIVIGGLGGVTSSKTQERMVWWRDVVITLAGPIFGALLGVACFVLARHAPLPRAAVSLLRLATQVNLYWAIFNLLPVLPMDGGRVSAAVLTRLSQRWGLVVATGLGLLLCGLALFFAARNQNDGFLAVFALLFGFRNFQVLTAAWRYATQTVPPVVLEATEKLNKGDLPGAKLLAERYLQTPESAGSPMGRSRAHRVLGWVALKEGQGRAALDHFSQVGGQRVEPHALAAAFSLIGDDGRALSLWEVAYKETPNPTILHEWGGALIRVGRDAELTRLPGLDKSAAYACAERVYFLRGEFSQAARVGELAFELSPSAERAYDIACAYARSNDGDRAVGWLQRASSLGYRDLDYARTDSDLASLHGNPGFQQWLSQGSAGV